MINYTLRLKRKIFFENPSRVMNNALLYFQNSIFKARNNTLYFGKTNLLVHYVSIISFVAKSLSKLCNGNGKV